MASQCDLQEGGVIGVGQSRRQRHTGNGGPGVRHLVKKGGDKSGGEPEPGAPEYLPILDKQTGIEAKRQVS